MRDAYMTRDLVLRKFAGKAHQQYLAIAQPQSTQRTLDTNEHFDPLVLRLVVDDRLAQP